MSGIFRFGEFELDTARFELKRGGASVDVQPKVLRLLQHLVEQRTRVVDTAELLQVLWPGTRVGTGSIKRAVLGARQALAERAEDQSRIRTIRGFGYQFVGEVTLVEHAEPARCRRRCRQHRCPGRACARAILSLVQPSDPSHA